MKLYHKTADGQFLELKPSDIPNHVALGCYLAERLLAFPAEAAMYDLEAIRVARGRLELFANSTDAPEEGDLLRAGVGVLDAILAEGPEKYGTCSKCGKIMPLDLLDAKDDGTGNYNILECQDCYGPGWSAP